MLCGLSTFSSSSFYSSSSSFSFSSDEMKLCRPLGVRSVRHHSAQVLYFLLLLFLPPCSLFEGQQMIFSNNSAMPAPLCVVCRGYHLAHVACPCYHCGLRHEGDCSLDDTLTSAFDWSSRAAICDYCGYQHLMHLPCPCLRCGACHDGDCSTVCARCNRCHGNKRCSYAQSVVSKNFRLRARTANEDTSVGAPVVRHDLGDMSVQCPHCRSRSWFGEKMNCCKGGVIVVPDLNDVPGVLSNLILSPHVRQNIRSYNTVMAFASVGHANKSFVDGTFVLGGRAYHRIGSLLPVQHQPHCFAQIYVLDTDNATRRRQDIIPSLRPFVLSQLHDMMMQFNHLARTFKAAADGCSSRSAPDNAIGFTWSAGNDLANFGIASLIEHAGYIVKL